MNTKTSAQTLEDLVPIIYAQINKDLQNKTLPSINPKDAHKAFRSNANGIALLKAYQKGDTQQRSHCATLSGETNHLPTRVPFVRFDNGQKHVGWMGLDAAIAMLESSDQLAYVWIVAILLHYPVNKSTLNKLMERNKYGEGLAFTMGVLMDEIVPIMSEVIQQFIKHEDFGEYSVTLICCLADGCTDCPGNAVLRDIEDQNRIAHFDEMIRIRVNTCKEALAGGHVVVKSGDVWDIFVEIMAGSIGTDVTMRNIGQMDRRNPLDPSMRVLSLDGFHRKDSETGKDTTDKVLHHHHPCAQYVARVQRQLDRITLEIISGVKTVEGWYFRTLIEGISSTYRDYDGDRTQLMIDLNSPQEKKAVVAMIKDLLLAEMAINE